MITTEKNGLKLLSFENLACEKRLKHSVSTREAGNLGLGGDKPENAAENLRRFCEVLGVPFQNSVRVYQENKANVRIIGKDFRFPDAAPAMAGRADAMVTGLKNTPLLVLSADCALTVFYDPARSVLAVSHCGWRGAFLNVYANVVGIMKMEFGSRPADILVGVSPMISVEHYPVKEDVIEKLKNFYPDEIVRQCLMLKEGRHHLNIRELLKYQLAALGIEKYEFAHLCTYSEKDLFFSRRREGPQTSHFGLLACLV